MPPFISRPLPSIKDELAKVARDWFDAVLYEVASAPRNLSSEELWSRYSQLLNHGVRLYKQLAYTARRSEFPITPSPVEDVFGPEITASEMLQGVVDFIKAARYSSFSERCHVMPLPLRHASPSSQRYLHKMLFQPSDCFIELGRIRPANHGWLFVFREELENWLLSAAEPFHVIYQDSKGEKTMYGIYQALPFPEGNMIGPEFAQLSEFTREIITTHISRSSKGTAAYHATDNSLLASHRQLRCVIFQCKAGPPTHERSNDCHVNDIYQDLYNCSAKRII